MVDHPPAFDALPMEFFRRLYNNTEDGQLEVRAIHFGGDKRCYSEWFPIASGDASYKAAIDCSARLNASGYDVFFGVNPRVRGGLEDKDVLSGVSLWADIDGLSSEAEAAEMLRKVLGQPLKPDAAIFSGGGLHLYFFLKEAFDPASDDWPRYCRGLKATAAQYDGDTKCVNPSRVLRFPGTLSHKRNERVRVWLRDL
jgi:hypothetical protein